MWAEIDAQTRVSAARHSRHRRRCTPTRERAASRVAWLGIAATLVDRNRNRPRLDVGRSSRRRAAATPAVAVASAESRRCRAPIRASTVRTKSRRRSTSDRPPRCSSRCRRKSKSGRTDQQFAARAADLLTRTRLLIDSPAANDPAMRNLLEDLELVLAQVVRLQNNGKPHRVGHHQPRAGTARRHSAAAHSGRRHFCELRRRAMKRTTLAMLLRCRGVGVGRRRSRRHRLRARRAPAPTPRPGAGARRRASDAARRFRSTTPTSDDRSGPMREQIDREAARDRPRDRRASTWSAVRESHARMRRDGARSGSRSTSDADRARWPASTRERFAPMARDIAREFAPMRRCRSVHDADAGNASHAGDGADGRQCRRRASAFGAARASRIVRRRRRGFRAIRLIRVYRLAHDVLNRGDYGRAAQTVQGRSRRSIRSRSTRTTSRTTRRSRATRSARPTSCTRPRSCSSRARRS